MTWLEIREKVLQCRTLFDWFGADEPRAPLLAAQGSCCNDSFIIKIKDHRAQTRHSSGVGGFSHDTGNNWREVSTIPASPKSGRLWVPLYANTGCGWQSEWGLNIRNTEFFFGPCDESESRRRFGTEGGEVDLCITVEYNFKNWSKRHVLNSRLCVIMLILSLHGADWRSHLGSSYDWGTLTSVTNELGSTRTTTAASTFSFGDTSDLRDALCQCLNHKPRRDAPRAGFRC